MSITPDHEVFKQRVPEFDGVSRQQVSTEQKLEQRVRELTAINNLSRAVTASLSLNRVVASIYEQMRSAINPDVTVVYLLQEDKLILQKVERGNPELRQTGSEVLSVGQCLCGIVVSDASPGYCKDIHNDPRCTLEECKDAGIRSFAAIPLIIENEIVGVLGVGSRTMRDFSEQADFLETLASQVAIGLKNAGLYEQVQRYSAQLDQQVTDLVRSREAMRESEERYRNLYEASPDIIFNISIPDGTISALNPAFEKITGWPATEWIGRPFTDILHPDDVAMAKQGFEMVLGGETTPALELRMRDKSGEILTGHSVGQPEIRHGKIIGAFGIARDVTDWVRAEKALRENEEHLRSLMESAANFAVYRLIFDPEAPGRFRVIFVSPSISDIIGLADPMKFGSWFENIHPDDAEKVSETSLQAFKTLKFDEKFRIYHQANREWRWVRAISTYIPDQDGRSKYVNGILFDISQAKKTEQQLENRTRHVEEANAALKVLLKQREADKSELEEKVVSNVKELIEPFLDKLKGSRLNEDQKANLNILGSNLQDIISPFAHRMSSRYLNFTPAEMQVANLIKQGKTTKEIANLLNLSGSTISFHRENIRDKLGLKNQRANLRSHLLSLE